MHSSINQQRIRDDERAREDVDRLLEALTTQTGETTFVEPLSDLSRAGAARLRERWSDIPLEERRTIIQTLAQDAESNIEHNFERVMLIALDDADAQTRRVAVEGLWECESTGLLDLLLDRVTAEVDPSVRAAQATALGRYVLRTELEDRSATTATRLREVLLDLVTTDPSLEVRRRALESIAYASDDEDVIQQIEKAFESGEYMMRVSALHAMGRQADARWIETVHQEFDSDEAEIRYEAVTAAGMIGDERSVPELIDMLRDEDAEVKLAAIAAIGEIGGKLAVNALRRLTKDDDTAVADAAEDALEEALLTSNPLRPLF